MEMMSSLSAKVRRSLLRHASECLALSSNDHCFFCGPASHSCNGDDEKLAVVLALESIVQSFNVMKLSQVMIKLYCSQVTATAAVPVSAAVSPYLLSLLDLRTSEPRRQALGKNAQS